jgi:hypothetical protein
MGARFGLHLFVVYRRPVERSRGISSQSVTRPTPCRPVILTVVDRNVMR